MDNSRLSGFSLAPIRELLSRCCFRNELKNSITSSPLGKILARKGVDLQYYIYSQPTTDIMKHMRNCERCHSQEQCDFYLGNKNMDNHMNLPFCQNNNPILWIKKQQDSLYVTSQYC